MFAAQLDILHDHQSRKYAEIDCPGTQIGLTKENDFQYGDDTANEHSDSSGDIACLINHFQFRNVFIFVLFPAFRQDIFFIHVRTPK
jgi:hypothetical protein